MYIVYDSVNKIYIYLHKKWASFWAHLTKQLQCLGKNLGCAAANQYIQKTKILILRRTKTFITFRPILTVF